MSETAISDRLTKPLSQELVTTDPKPQLTALSKRKLEFLELLKLFKFNTRVCQEMKIETWTPQTWRDNDEDFRKAYDQIREGFYSETNDKAESTIAERLTKEGKEWLALDWLKTNHERWRKADQAKSLTQVNLVNFSADRSGRDFVSDAEVEAMPSSLPKSKLDKSLDNGNE